MYFGINKPEEHRLQQLHELLKQTTGAEYDKSKLKEILHTYERFEQFIVNNGGSMIAPESWILSTFLAWCSHSMAFLDEEAELLRQLREQVVAQEADKFQISPDMVGTLRKLFGIWLEKK